jgi:hypothetical protein
MKHLLKIFLAFTLFTSCNWDTYGPVKIVSNYWLMSIDSWEHAHIFYAEDPAHRSTSNMLVPFSVKKIFLNETHLVVIQMPHIAFENDTTKTYHLIEIDNHKSHVKFHLKSELDSSLQNMNMINILQNEFKLFTTSPKRH